MIGIPEIDAAMALGDAEHLEELDENIPDGPAKRIVAWLAWGELVLDWEDGDELINMAQAIQLILDGKEVPT